MLDKFLKSMVMAFCTTGIAFVIASVLAKIPTEALIWAVYIAVLLSIPMILCSILYPKWLFADDH